MRCLGRLFLLLVVLVGAAVGWLYRDELHRWVDGKLHPAAVAARLGRPSPEALHHALARLDSLRHGRDSVVLRPDELASLLVQGSSFLPGASSDSFSVELGDRTVRVRTVIDSARLPAQVRALMPGKATRYADVVVRGELTPVRAGVAELAVQHVMVRGIPVPGDLVARVAAQLTGKEQRGRVEFALPQSVGGFRVRPDGVAVYRAAGRP